MILVEIYRKFAKILMIGTLLHIKHIQIVSYLIDLLTRIPIACVISRLKTQYNCSSVSVEKKASIFVSINQSVFSPVNKT